MVIGKTNVPARCLDMQTLNKVFGTTRNPYDLSRTSGGSSGGSAAAVAAGMVNLAIGSDLAGSLRIPASFCGVSSIKPTSRRISPRGHFPNVACMQNNLTLGALARDVDTLELFMQAACASSAELAGDDDVWEDVLPPLPFKPLPDVDLRHVRVLLTPELPGVLTGVHVCVLALICVYVRLCICEHACVCARACMYAHTQVSLRARVHTRARAHTHTHTAFRPSRGEGYQGIWRAHCRSRGGSGGGPGPCLRQPAPLSRTQALFRIVRKQVC